ncbi:helix-turn-helix domain-containing protein [Methylotenera mobilis]|uniref:HTH cro/C1-type domain-containing protein n=1 Tax=Methylotenera mobilis (strain JLW8 / ATCC BAA-1282 / DSM 17540) TaxID=583345 RepID=C6WWS9_METML|nr:helix-turn-helix transcriptional regulator [Methylotenera mobilis]ACT48378.1 hypothetical protein Mmol_1474 [Methylotenera mobilis JLW8]
MEYANIKTTSISIAQKAKQLNITQEVISKAIGASQSQVSRVFSGRSKRTSRVFVAICNYVNKYQSGVTTEMVSRNHELLEAIASVWDGSERQSNALASVIRTLGLVMNNNEQPVIETKAVKNK